jgi:dTDP-glucose 4,6-dehydratase
MSKRVLLTGSAGFIGRHVVDHFIANTDWEIIGIDSFNHRGDSLRVHSDTSRHTIFTHDLSTPLSYRLINKIGDIDYIINMASESHVDRSITDPVPFILNNVKVALNMLEYARVVKPDAFIQVSTDEVYGPALDGYNHKEGEPHLPSNPYSASKSSQESIAHSYWRTYGVPVIITNTMNNVGQYQDSEKFVPMLINRINSGVKVDIHGSKKDGIGSRYYLHARNHADAILFLLKNIKPTMYYDTTDKIIVPDKYNIVGEIELSNLELAQMVADILGKKLKYRLVDHHGTRPGHDRRYALDGTKMKELGWEPPVPFRESLEELIDWTLQHREWLE